jgi:hypothetical protein
MGKGTRVIERQARGSGPQPLAIRRAQLGHVSLRLLNIVSRPGGATGGEAMRELPLGLCNDVTQRLGFLYDRGHITRRMDGRHWRYFIGREAAEAWERGEAEAADEAPAAAAELAVPESFAAQWRRLRGEGAAA